MATLTSTMQRREDDIIERRHQPCRRKLGLVLWTTMGGMQSHMGKTFGTNARQLLCICLRRLPADVRHISQCLWLVLLVSANVLRMETLLTFTLQRREDGNIGINNADANKVRFLEQWAMTACLHFFTNPYVTAVLMEWQVVVFKLSRLCELENFSCPTSTNLLRMETLTSTMQSREDGISQWVWLELLQIYSRVWWISTTTSISCGWQQRLQHRRHARFLELEGVTVFAFWEYNVMTIGRF
jgi:hypothetical protein